MTRPLDVHLVSPGSGGDVFPFVRLGQRVVERGHRATLHVNPLTRALLLGAFSSEFERLSLVTDGVAAQVMFGRALTSASQPDTTLEMLVAGLSVPTDMARQLEYWRAVLDGRSSAVVVAHQWSFGAQAVAIASSTPLIVADFAPHVASAVPDLVDRTIQRTPETAAMLGHLGWTPIVNSDWTETEMAPVTVAAAASPVVSSSAPARWLGYPWWDGGRQTTVDHFPAPELSGCIVVTLGTLFRRRRDLLTSFVDEVARVSQRPIVVAGQGISEPTTRNSGVLYAGYLPLSRVLPYAAGMLSHGGSGTLHQAAFFSVDHAVRPLGVDQPFVAEAFVQQGLAAAVDGSEQLHTWVDGLRGVSDPRLPDERFSADRAASDWLELIERIGGVA